MCSLRVTFGDFHTALDQHPGNVRVYLCRSMDYLMHNLTHYKANIIIKIVMCDLVDESQLLSNKRVS